MTLNPQTDNPLTAEMHGCSINLGEGHLYEAQVKTRRFDSQYILQHAKLFTGPQYGNTCKICDAEQ